MRKIDQAKYDEKRRHILEAAEECFRRDGLRGASIDDICAVARMSPGHLYHYFTSKEAMIEALFESHTRQEAAAFGELTPNKDLVAAICWWLDRRLKNIRAHSALGLEMRAESSHNPAIARILGRADRRVRELLGGLVRKAQQQGQIDPGLDPDVVAAILASIVFGLNRLGSVRDPTFDMKAASAALKLLMERFLRPRASHPAKPAQPAGREEYGRKTRRERRGVQA